MGIYGAINAAISGLRSQSYALENISGNIANSQTTGYKRLDTSFSDLVASGGNDQRTQIAGTVISNSRATNDIAGDIQRSDIDTYMAINGDGYFVVQEKIGEADGRPIFSESDSKVGLCFQCLACLLTSRITPATYIHVCSVWTDRSKSLESLLARESHAKVRSTTQRRGSSWKPLTPAGLWTIWIFHGPQSCRSFKSFFPR